MKKVINVFIAAIFLISIAAVAFAEENATETDNVTVVTTAASEDAGQNKLTQQTSKDFEQKRADFLQQAQAKRQELVQKREEARAHLGEGAKNFKARNMALREKYLEKKSELKEKAAKATERKEQAKEKHAEAKARLAEKKGQLAECKGDSGEECAALRAGAKKDAGEFLTNIADHVLALLEKTKERVAASKMGDAEKTNLLEQLDIKLAEVAGISDSVATFTENTTKEEITEAAKAIRDAWAGTKSIIKKGAGLAAADRLGGVIVKSERLQAKLEKVIGKLKDKGKDVSAAEDLKSDFDEKLAQAKNLHEEAKALFKEGKVPEAAQNTQDAHAALKEAHSILKDIVRELKGTKEGVEALDTAEEEGTAVTGTTAIAEEAAEEETETAEETTEITEEAEQENEETEDSGSAEEVEDAEEETEETNETAE